MNDVIETSGLTRQFDDETVVDGLDLLVPKGSVFGLIGRNGAGKTTTLRMLLGLQAPSSGSATVLGEDSMALSKATRQRIGYLSEESFPYDDLPFADVLKFVSGFFEVWDWQWCEHLVERLRVDRTKMLGSMSKGQRRVAELLLAVAHKPDLLILDDPAVAMDAGVRREVLWALLETVQEQGSTVLFSSHILQDVERVVDHVGILEDGKLRWSGALDELKARTRRLVLSAGATSHAIEGEIQRQALGQDVVVVTQAYEPAMDQQVAAIESAPMNLEEIFLAMTDGKEVAS